MNEHAKGQLLYLAVTCLSFFYYICADCFWARIAAGICNFIIALFRTNVCFVEPQQSLQGHSGLLYQLKLVILILREDFPMTCSLCLPVSSSPWNYLWQIANATILNFEVQRLTDCIKRTAPNRPESDIEGNGRADLWWHVTFCGLFWYSFIHFEKKIKQKSRLIWLSNMMKMMISPHKWDIYLLFLLASLFIQFTKL